MSSVAHRNPLPTFETNIRGTYNLLEACRVHPDLVKRVVIASSDKAYGPHEQLPYTEDMPLQGQHPYEVSKSCADLIAQAYHHTYGLPVAILRCGNIYGGGDLNWSRIVPYTIRCFLNEPAPGHPQRRPICARLHLRQRREPLLHEDGGKSFTTNTCQGQAFNFSLERPVTVLEIVKAIQQLMNCQHLEPDVQNTASGEIRAQYLSAAKTHRVLDWQPQFTLEQGLKETIAWYREYLATHKEAGLKFRFAGR